MKNEGKNTCWDILLLGAVLLTGAAEAAHLAAVVFNWSLGRCCVLFWILAGAALICEAALCIGFRRQKGRQTFVPLREHGRPDKREAAAWILFAVLAASQMIFICMKDSGVRQGDIMAETVESFLATDRVYQVNPMTGRAYTEGIPLRLKILCLPFLYSSICKITGLSAAVAVRTLVPAVILILCYAAFAALGNALFAGGAWRPEGVSGQDMADKGVYLANRRGYAWFMAVAALLLWAGAGMDGMEGCRLLWSGWQGAAIRNCVLTPWLFSLCLRRKWRYVPLCILAEACITWTLYGMGMCFAAAFLMAGIQICARRRKESLQVQAGE